MSWRGGILAGAVLSACVVGESELAALDGRGATIAAIPVTVGPVVEAMTHPIALVQLMEDKTNRVIPPDGTKWRENKGIRYKSHLGI